MPEPERRSQIDAIAEGYLARVRDLDPTSFAADCRFDELPERLTDHSPEAAAERAAAAAALRGAVARAVLGGHRDRIAAESIRERMDVLVDEHAAGAFARAVGVVGTPMPELRVLFAMLAPANAEEWERYGLLLADVPHSVSSYKHALEHGVATGHPGSRRQALALGALLEQTANERFFAAQVAGAPARQAEQLGAAARRADAAFGALGAWMAGEYARAARVEDGVGRDAYLLACRRFNGADCDPEATYALGFAELARVRAEMGDVAEAILPGADVAGAVAFLDADPARSAPDVAALAAWAQELVDRAVEELAGACFDIAPALRRIAVRIAPPGSAAATYYTSPSPDFVRPGTVWYADLGVRRPLWRETVVAYHEGVPGHHLQFGHVYLLGERLNAFQRTLGLVSGHVEGWASYAERLMDELGHFAEPGVRLGMLANRALRAVRLVIDVGLHLGLRLPADQDFHPGERLTPELASELLATVALLDEAAASEIDRYLGMPGQATSYALGEQAWLEARAAARRRAGPGFALADFHREALDLGFVGLGQLRGAFE